MKNCAISRRNALKLAATATACAVVGTLGSPQAAEAAAGEHMLTIGIITDAHKTSKADTATRKYSASTRKMEVFLQEMKAVKPR